MNYIVTTNGMEMILISSLVILGCFLNKIEGVCKYARHLLIAYFNFFFYMKKRHDE